MKAIYSKKEQKMSKKSNIKPVEMVLYSKKLGDLNTRRTIIKQIVRIPLFKKDLEFSINLVEFFRPKDLKITEWDFQKSIQDIRNKKPLIFDDPVNKIHVDFNSFCIISDENPMDEYQSHGINPRNQRFGIYIKVREKGKKVLLPDFYGILFLNLFDESLKQLYDNGFLDFINGFSGSINYLIQIRRTDPGTLLEFYKYFIPLAQEIQKYFEVGSVDIEMLNKFIIQNKYFEERGNKIYWLLILKSFIQELIEKKKIFQCLDCNKIVDFENGKKFCNKRCKKRYNDSLYYKRHKREDK